MTSIFERTDPYQEYDAWQHDTQYRRTVRFAVLAALGVALILFLAA